MSRPGQRRKLRDRQRGVVAVMAALLVPLVMGAFLALAFNIGLLMKTRTDLQSASDSAALAAAGSLNGTTTGLIDATGQAWAFSREHLVINDAVKIDDAAAMNEDVRFGHWHSQSEPCAFSAGTCAIGFEECRGDTDCAAEATTCQPSCVLTSNAFAASSVLVRNGTDDGATRNASVGVVLGPFLGSPGRQSLASSAIAIGAHGRADCSLPIAVGACRVLDGGACNTTTPKVLNFTNENLQELGWINVLDRSSNPNTTFVQDAILNYETNCSSNSGEPFVGGTAPTSNGNNLQPIIDALLGIDNNQQTGPCHLGVLRGMAVVKCGTSGGGVCNTGSEATCSPEFSANEDRLILGYVTVVIDKVTCANGTELTAATCTDENVAKACTGGGGQGQGQGQGGGGGGTSNLAIHATVTCGAPPGPTGGPGLNLRLVR